MSIPIVAESRSNPDEWGDGYAVGVQAGLDLAARFVESHTVMEVKQMPPALPDRVLGFGMSADNDLLAAGIRGLAQ